MKIDISSFISFKGAFLIPKECAIKPGLKLNGAFDKPFLSHTVYPDGRIDVFYHNERNHCLGVPKPHH